MAVASASLKTEVLIVGAGLIGSAIAMELAKKGETRVTVVDLDLSGEWSSSELNAGGVRATWSQKLNLLASKLTIEYFERVADEVGYRPCGYLWMHRKDTFDAALKAREMHVAAGWPVDVLDVAKIRDKAPFIDKTDDLAGALYGVKDGLVNSNRVKEHYRDEAAKLGVKFVDGVWVRASESLPGKRSKVIAFQFQEGLSSAAKKSILIANPKDENAFAAHTGSMIEIEATHVVNAAGAWAPELAKILGYSSPSYPLKRQISLFHSRDLDLNHSGMIIDPSGVYFHPEAIYGLAGFATPDETPGFNFEYDQERFFEEQIWPALYERSTQFESLKHVSGWAGLYENSPDHHGIVGQVSELFQKQGSFFEAHSFSGHGVMQSYAVGIAIAELILTGRYETLDFGSLSGDRFITGKKIESETWVI